jgi:SP family sugar:H+ symporter-like MFS transporter
MLGQVSALLMGEIDKPVLGVNISFLWGATNALCFLYVYFFIPELRGLELEQVDELYRSLNAF